MAAAAATTTTAGSDLSDGPVQSLINKRLRGLRKKYNRILQMEESISQGKPINKEQEDVLRSKPAVVALIDELDKLRQPLSAAVDEELDLALRHVSVPAVVPEDSTAADKSVKASSDDEASGDRGGCDGAVEDLLRLLYFGTLFDWKPQSEFASTMLTRSHERECCLTYDTVTDDATEMLGQRDLDLISMLGGLVLSRPLGSGLSHQNALQGCVEHAKLWLANSDHPIHPESEITYTALKDRLNKIMKSHYFTQRPEIKAPGEVAAAAGNYGSFQIESVSAPVQVEGSVAQYQQLDEVSGQFEGHESGDNTLIPVEELHKDEPEMENPSADAIKKQQDKPQVEPRIELNEQDVESKEQQHMPRRSHQNQRPGRGSMGGSSTGTGRKGYFNVRGGGRSSGRGGGGFQNGRNQYYDQPGNYYTRGYYNKGRGGRAGGGGGQSYYDYGPAVQVGHAPENVGSGS